MLPKAGSSRAIALRGMLGWFRFEMRALAKWESICLLEVVYSLLDSTGSGSGRGVGIGTKGIRGRAALRWKAYIDSGIGFSYEIGALILESWEMVVVGFEELGSNGRHLGLSLVSR